LVVAVWSVEEEAAAGAEFVADVVADGEAEALEFADIFFEGRCLEGRGVTVELRGELGGGDLRLGVDELKDLARPGPCLLRASMASNLARRVRSSVGVRLASLGGCGLRSGPRYRKATR